MYSFKEEFSRANNPFAFGKNGKKIRIMMNYACAAAILKMLKIKYLELITFGWNKSYVRLDSKGPAFKMAQPLCH